MVESGGIWPNTLFKVITMLGDGPSKAKLEGLRRQGIVPITILATRAWILAAVFGMILFLGDRVHEKLLSAPDALSAVWSEPGRTLEPFLLAIAILSGVTLVVGVLTTTLQTRGASGVPMLRTTARPKEKGDVTYPLKISLVATGALICAYWLLPQMLHMIRLAIASQIDAYFGAVVAKVCKLVVVVAVVLAILVMFVSRSAFAFRHRKKEGADSW